MISKEYDVDNPFDNSLTKKDRRYWLDNLIVL